ncbi:MAG: diacylglycerol kinase family lipid kinase [Clostridiales bacterium]|nr:diacylglycerol kinase family lipid kinase [Clostridiales bacterium]
MKCLFIYNPNSGRGKIKKKESYIVDKLKTKYTVVDVVQTKYQGHAYNYVSKEYGLYDTVVIAGGDGTLNEIINAIAEKPNAPTIGYIPTGTVNDLAHSLKIPKNIKKAVQIILNGKLFNHDIFKCNNKYGIYVCTTGLFTDTSYSTKQTDKNKLGKLAYYLYGAKKIFKTDPINVKITYDDKLIEKNCALLLILNSKQVSGFKINKNAILDDGYVDVVMIDAPKKKGFSLFSLIRVFKLFLFGLNYCKNKKNITYLKLKDFKVQLKSKAKINLDGEQGFKGTFDFKSIKKGVSIFIK